MAAAQVEEGKEKDAPQAMAGEEESFFLKQRWIWRRR
jgi:hypothetical protein